MIARIRSGEASLQEMNQFLVQKGIKPLIRYNSSGEVVAYLEESWGIRVAGWGRSWGEAIGNLLLIEIKDV